MIDQRTNRPNKHSTPKLAERDSTSVALIDLIAAFPRLAVVYLRRGQRELPPDAIRDLEQYLDMLRSYYGIPAGHPVFPPRPDTVERRARSSKSVGRPSKAAKNAATHPWRAA